MVQAQVMGHDDRHPNPYQSHDDMELVPGMVKGLELEQALEGMGSSGGVKHQVDSTWIIEDKMSNCSG